MLAMYWGHRQAEVSRKMDVSSSEENTSHFPYLLPEDWGPLKLLCRIAKFSIIALLQVNQVGRK
jgi:hypothetical protein